MCIKPAVLSKKRSTSFDDNDINLLALIYYLSGQECLKRFYVDTLHGPDSIIIINRCKQYNYFSSTT